MALEHAAPECAFRHEALLYADEAEFVEQTVSFLRTGLANDDAMLAVVEAPKIRLLREALGADADGVQFADMTRVGRNPALIIQAWRDFVEVGRRRGRSLRGIGEPISPRRTAAALTECHIHESLLNVAFRDEPDFWLVCPYDTTALAEPIIDHAIVNHPFVRTGRDDRSDSSHTVGHSAGFTRPLPPPRGDVDALSFDKVALVRLRRFVRARARAAGVASARVDELAVAVSEIASNTLGHGTGNGVARLWTEDGHFLCEISGPGHITDPLVGRLRPDPARTHGRGVWIANQFCDLVQIRSSELGTTVRLHVPHA